MTLLRQKISDYSRNVNWQLLFFLVIVLDVKMVIKIAGLVGLLVLNRKMLFDKNIFRQKFIWFYFGMIIIGLINLVITISSLSVNYAVVVLTGIGFWLMCIIAGIITWWQVLKTELEKLHTTVTIFFMLNIVVSIIQLLMMMWDSGSFNPYRYQGMHQKYFMSAGDYITGITFDVCTTNALLCSFGLLYFLCRNKMVPALLCMLIILLTASNFTNILLLGAFLFLFLFQSDRNQKSIIIVCSFLLLIFLVKVSPQNGNYITRFLEKKNFDVSIRSDPEKERALLLAKPDSALTRDERKRRTAILYLDSLYLSKVTNDHIDKNKPVAVTRPEKPSIPQANIHTEPYQKNRDTTHLQKELLAFAETKITSFDTSLSSVKGQKEPGKLIALKQTINFFKQYPLRIFTGAGIANFSSKLAFRVSGLRIAGGYPARFSYINDDFKTNHLKLYLEYFTKEMELHSLTNTPNSVYDQLAAEYGLAGVFLFVFLYLGFFLRQWRKLTYALPVLLILIGALCVEYWFEQLSIVILFELLFFLNIKETKEKNE